MVGNMTKAEFNRTLPDGFLGALNAAYSAESGWWRNLADDPHIFIAIRNGYLNAYYKGNSVMRLNLGPGGQLRGSTHYKYLLKPSHRPEYVSVVDGQPVIASHEQLFLSDLSDVALLKNAAKPYAGVEKAGVHEIIKSNPNIVDVEIAFGSVSAADGKATAPRMDFAALQSNGEEVRLTFFEAKHFSNKELKASADNTPPVVAQIERYSALLRTHADEVHDAYLSVFSYFLGMKGNVLHNPVRAARDRLMELVLSEKKRLVIDLEPRLVIFGFDDDQKKGKVWAPHIEKLKNGLRSETKSLSRVLSKGDPKSFTVGISATTGAV